MYQTLSNFMIKPTATSLPVGSRPDELMFNWGALADGATAQIFLPGANAADIRAEANRLYGAQPFTLIDANTLGCVAAGRTYMPIPVGSGGSLVGLLAVAMPSSSFVGQKYQIVVSQITTPLVAGGDRTFVSPRTSAKWRKIAGLFQLTVAAESQASVLPVIERQLSIARWIFEAMTATNPWRPVFLRYLKLLAAEIITLGGKPEAIPPTSSGVWSEGCPGEGDGWCGEGGDLSEDVHVMGKVEELIFDRFGDFCGFVLLTDQGERRSFATRERGFAELIEWAWKTRLRIAVATKRRDIARPVQVRLFPPASPTEM